MIKIAFCDDKISELNEINKLLEQYCAESDQEIICTAFHNPLELLFEIEKGKRLDILFLDIIMPGECGINVAKEIRQYDKTVKIIFLTSSSEFAVESYAVDAYYYQIKPVCRERFFQLMDSAISDHEKMEKNDLILHCKNGITKINLEKLEYCEVMGRKLFFHLENGKILESTGSLDKLYQKLLEYENFIRPHRSYLVNMEYIQSISYKTIIMDNHVEIPIPHGKYSEMKNRYLEYAFNRKKVFLL